MKCNYDAVTLRLPAKQFSHCIALTIKRALNCIILKYGIVCKYCCNWRRHNYFIEKVHY